MICLKSHSSHQEGFTLENIKCDYEIKINQQLALASAHYFREPINIRAIYKKTITPLDCELSDNDLKYFLHFSQEIPNPPSKLVTLLKNENSEAEYNLVFQNLKRFIRFEAKSKIFYLKIDKRCKPFFCRNLEDIPEIYQLVSTVVKTVCSTRFSQFKYSFALVQKTNFYINCLKSEIKQPNCL
nr:hypothetical protein [Madagascaria erythrocladioides]